MKKIKKIVLIVLSGLLVASLTLLSLSFIYEKEIKQFALQNISENIQTKIEVKEIQLSFIRQFPYASLVFNDVVVHEFYTAKNPGNDTLLIAESVYLNFNLIEILLNKKAKLEAMHINDGFIRIGYNQHSIPNFNVLTDNIGNKDENNSFSGNLEELICKNLSFHYFDKAKKLAIRYDIHSLKQKIEINNGNLQIENKLKGFSQNIILDGLKYLQKKQVNFDGIIRLTKEFSQLEIASDNLSINALKLAVAGKLLVEKESTISDIFIESNNINLEELNSLSEKQLFNNLILKGNLALNGHIKGISNKKQLPGLHVTMRCNNGELQYQSLQANADQINFAAKLDIENMANPASGQLKVDTLFFESEEGKFSLSGELKNFVEPNFNLNISGKVNLEKLKNFIPAGSIHHFAGFAKPNLNIKGTLKEENKQNSFKFISEITTGSLSLEDAVIQKKENGNVLYLNKLELNFNQKEIVMKTTQGKLDDIAFTANGELKNLWGYLLNDDNKLWIKADFQSENVDFNPYLNSNNNNNDTANTIALALSAGIDLNLNLNVKKLHIGKLHAENVSGKITAKDKKILLENLSLQTCEGQVTISGLGNFNQIPYPITTDASLASIEIKQLFQSFNNFGQSHITHENISGKGTAEIQSILYFDKNFNLLTPQFYTRAEISIENGKLINYATLYHLSRFISLDELKNVSFGKLQNTIEIKNEAVFIPQMQIQTNALNLSLSATHYFNQNIEYAFKIYLRDLLAKKARNNKNENTEFGEEIEDTDRGKGLALFIRMYGNTDQPKFSYDRKGVKASFQQQIKVEKTTIKSLLNEEFGLFKKDSFIPYNKPSLTIKPDVVWSEFAVDSTKKTEKSALQKKIEEENKQKKSNSKIKKFLDNITKEGLEEEKE